VRNARQVIPRLRYIILSRNGFWQFTAQAIGVNLGTSLENTQKTWAGRFGKRMDEMESSACPSHDKE
jgi:hypothetical protein